METLLDSFTDLSNNKYINNAIKIPKIPDLLCVKNKVMKLTPAPPNNNIFSFMLFILNA